MPTIQEIEQRVARVWQASCTTPWAAALDQQLRASALVGVKVTLEAALREELTVLLGRPRYGRAAAGTTAPLRRSGCYTRHLLTSYGRIPDLRVPKLRSGNRPRPWRVLERYQRLAPHTLDQLLYLYTLGLSLRDLQEALVVLLGATMSRSAINRITAHVDDAMTAWRTRPLPATPPVLIVDGVWVTILAPTGQTFTDRSGHQRQHMRGQERVVLVAMAVWPDGQHTVLHYQVATTEDATTWGALFQALRTRGLDPQQVRMVVADGSAGVLEALATELPTTALQRCVVHKVRGCERLLRYTALDPRSAPQGAADSLEAARAQHRTTFATEALAIFAAPTRAAAAAQLSTFTARWQEREPAAVHSLTWGIRRCLTFYDQVDAALYPLVRSTNLIERFLREFRSRADEMGAFPNETSCLLVFHLVVLREHAKHDRTESANTG
jgi:transposase-like protein